MNNIKKPNRSYAILTILMILLGLSVALAALVLVASYA